MKLAHKLTLAFVAVILLFAGLVLWQIRRANSREVRLLALDRDQAEMAQRLAGFYADKRSWGEVGRFIITLDGVPTAGDGPRAPIGEVFGVIDAGGKFVLRLPPNHPRGSPASDSLIAKGTPIVVDGERVGTVVSARRTPVLQSGEQEMLDRINHSLFMTTLIATGAALLIGWLLAQTLTRPIIHLTKATQALARGELKQPIEVRSQDEIGRLGTAFNRMQADLALAKQQRDQMTADIAHDLRTPVTVLAGYIEAMQDGTLQATPERWQTLADEIGYLQHLIGDLNTLASADAGTLTCHPAKIEAHTLFNRVTQRYQLSAEQADITLTCAVQAAMPALYVDEERMAQMLGNLVDNALRYTPALGSVALAASATDDAFLLTVSDTGSGIAPQNLPFIFDRAFRSDKARAGEHMGLGLSIVKAIVTLHGGSVSATAVGATETDSTSGARQAETQSQQGTRFTITLPRA